ncbi:hypothetical protein BH23CYA1_BH23CYA1_19540 [soil metagenome]
MREVKRKIRMAGASQSGRVLGVEVDMNKGIKPSEDKVLMMGNESACQCE